MPRCKTSKTKPAVRANAPRRLLTCSRTASRVSNTRTTAPMDLAQPMDARPATPPPMTSTLAGGTRPAAVIWPVKKRPKWCAASMTALRGRVQRGAVCEFEVEVGGACRFCR